MSFKVSGNFDKMLDWAGLMRESHILVESQSRAMADAMLEMVDQEFESETDPYGQRWAPKKKPDGRKVLAGKTGRLRRGWRVVKANRRQFSIAPSVPYGAHHQAPRFNRRPFRMMVPNWSRGIPPHWQRRMIEAANVTALAYWSGKAVKGVKALVRRLGF